MTIKQNIKNWINQYKSLNDQIEIYDPKIVNFAIDFSVMVDKKFSQDAVLQDCIRNIKIYFSTNYILGNHFTLRESTKYSTELMGLLM